MNTGTLFAGIAPSARIFAMSGGSGSNTPLTRVFERDINSPTVYTLFRICDALDVSAADLVRRVAAATKRKPGR